MKQLHRELAQNPYSPRVLHLLSKKFPNLSPAEIITTILLAEPPGGYDTHWKLQTIVEQVEEFLKQIDVSARTHERFVTYCEHYTKELQSLSREAVYDRLSLIVFETNNAEVIEQRYSQKQRRTFRLAIIHFIEESQGRTPYVLPKKKPLLQWQPLQVVVLVLFFLIFGLSEYAVVQIAMRQESKKQILGDAVLKEKKNTPVRLRIPSINVDTIIEDVGIDSTGTMEVPHDTTNVGWFSLGPRPGEKGNAVIAGHFDGKNGETGVFSQLHTLNVGDKLYIEDSQGKSLVFVVQKSREYKPGYADAVFRGNDSTAHLNLITCDGQWNAGKKTYTKRLVVFTDILQ